MRLFDDPLPKRDQTIENPAGFSESPTVKTVRYLGCLLDHMAGHLLECFDRFFPAFRVAPVELLDSQQEFLSGTAVGAKGFPKGYLLANPFNLLDDLLPNPVQEIGVRRIGDVFGLSGRIYRYTLGLHQSHARPGPEQHRLNLLHPFSTDPVPKLHQGGGFQNLPPWKVLNPQKHCQ